MELKFMAEPRLDAKLMGCPHCGEKRERIWIHSQKERRLRCAIVQTDLCGNRGVRCSDCIIRTGWYSGGDVVWQTDVQCKSHWRLT